MATAIHPCTPGFSTGISRFIRPLPGLFRLLLSLFLLTSAYAAPPESHRVAMRDGTLLATDVYLPGEDHGTGPWPVILLRFPYNKALAAGIGPSATERGYVFVAQDTRGRFESEGANLPFDADGRADGQWDGLDTVRWIARQNWCNGRIGTWGGSAGAITQYLLAGTHPPEVVSQHLVVGAPGLFHDSIYRGGIFRKAMVEDWLSNTGYATHALSLWTTNYPYTDYWKDRDITQQYAHIQAAGMHIGGWFDIFAQATVDAFLGYQQSKEKSAAGRQRLILGPWTHGILTEKAGDLTFPGGNKPPQDVQDAWKWFDLTLGQASSESIDSHFPVVTYYTMGATGEPDAPGNVWRTADSWPPVPTQPRELHLNPDRSATWEPAVDPGTLSYVSDPTNPVPSVGGYELSLPAGPRDQTSVESRQDVLVFTTDPLVQPMEITGNAEAVIWIESDVPDADLIVRLCDVYPDGRSFNICEGALRLSVREGWDRQHFLPIGEPVRVRIPLWPTSMVFNRGHRLRIHVASSSAPALEPNLQNGLPPRTGSPQTGRLQIHCGTGDRASFLVLPVVEPSTDPDA